MGVLLEADTLSLLYIGENIQKAVNLPKYSLKVVSFLVQIICQIHCYPETFMKLEEQ